MKPSVVVLLLCACVHASVSTRAALRGRPTDAVLAPADVLLQVAAPVDGEDVFTPRNADNGDAGAYTDPLHRKCETTPVLLDFGDSFLQMDWEEPSDLDLDEDTDGGDNMLDSLDSLLNKAKKDNKAIPGGDVTSPLSELEELNKEDDKLDINNVLGIGKGLSTLNIPDFQAGAGDSGAASGSGASPAPYDPDMYGCNHNNVVSYISEEETSGLPDELITDPSKDFQVKFCWRKPTPADKEIEKKKKLFDIPKVDPWKPLRVERGELDPEQEITKEALEKEAEAVPAPTAQNNVTNSTVPEPAPFVNETAPAPLVLPPEVVTEEKKVEVEEKKMTVPEKKVFEEKLPPLEKEEIKEARAPPPAANVTTPAPAPAPAPVPPPVPKNDVADEPIVIEPVQEVMPAECPHPTAPPVHKCHPEHKPQQICKHVVKRQCEVKSFSACHPEKPTCKPQCRMRTVKQCTARIPKACFQQKQRCQHEHKVCGGTPSEEGSPAENAQEAQTSELKDEENQATEQAEAATEELEKAKQEKMEGEEKTKEAEEERIADEKLKVEAEKKMAALSLEKAKEEENAASTMEEELQAASGSGLSKVAAEGDSNLESTGAVESKLGADGVVSKETSASGEGEGVDAEGKDAPDGSGGAMGAMGDGGMGTVAAMLDRKLGEFSTQVHDSMKAEVNALKEHFSSELGALKTQAASAIKAHATGEPAPPPAEPAAAAKTPMPSEEMPSPKEVEQQAGSEVAAEIAKEIAGDKNKPAGEDDKGKEAGHDLEATSLTGADVSDKDPLATRVGDSVSGELAYSDNINSTSVAEQVGEEVAEGLAGKANTDKAGVEALGSETGDKVAEELSPDERNTLTTGTEEQIQTETEEIAKRVESELEGKATETLVKAEEKDADATTATAKKAMDGTAKQQAVASELRRLGVPEKEVEKIERKTATGGVFFKPGKFSKSITGTDKEGNVKFLCVVPS